MMAEFLLTSLVIVVTPGTGVLYTVATGLAGGVWRSLLAAVGCTLGIVPHMAAAILGLAAILHTGAVAFQVVKLLGVAYLLFMAWTVWRDRGPLALSGSAVPPAAWAVVGRAVVINLLNPKLSLFFLAFLPQFVGPAEADPLWRLTGLSAAFMAMTLVVFVGYGALAASVRDHVLHRPRVVTWMRRAVAGAFVALGARLALAQP